MKFVTALILLAAGIAQAQTTATTFTFSPASDYSCFNYCTGYFTSDPSYTIGYINLQYAGAAGYTITTRINGEIYQGTVPMIFDGGALYNTNRNGTFVTMTDVNYKTDHHCVRVGRGQSCKIVYNVTDGKVAP